MSNLYKNNDDFLRDKLSGHEFESVPGAWDDMSNLLNQQKLIQSSGKSLWWSIPILSAVILTGVIGTGIYFKSNIYSSNQLAQQPTVINDLKTSKQAKQSVEKTADIAATNVAKQARFSELNPTNNTNKSTTILPGQDLVDQPLTTNSRTIEATTSANKKLAATSNSPTIVPQVNQQLRNATTTSNQTDNSSSGEQINQTLNSVNTNHIPERNVQLDAADKSAFRAYINQESNNFLKTSNSKTSSDKPIEKKVITTSTDVLLKNKADNRQSLSTFEQVFPTNLPANTEAEEPPSKKVKTVIINQFSRSTFLKQQKLKKIENPTEPVSFGVNTDLSNRRICPIKFSIFGGISGQYVSSINEFNFAPTVGLAGSYKIAARHGIRLGIQYKSISRNNRQADLETTELRYDAGLIASKSYMLQHLDLLEMPLSYQFYFNKFINLNTGIKAAWVVNHKSSNVAFDELKATELGIANFNLGLLLGIEFNINRHFTIAIQYNQGLLNLSSQGQLNEQQMMETEENMGINSVEKQTALTNQGEALTPVFDTGYQQQLVRVPYRLYNSDIMFLLTYTF